MSYTLRASYNLVGLPYELTTSSYKQLAIGISKKHVLALAVYDIVTRKPKDQFRTGTELVLH